MARFLLIRHAITDMVGKKIGGRLPGVHLNEVGRLQAEVLAQRLAPISIDEIISSPLERALETAAAIASIKNLPVKESGALLEIDFGAWTNTAIESLIPDQQFQLFNTFRSSTPIPGGELMMTAQLRMVSYMQQTATQYPSGVFALVSHSDLIKAAVAHFAGMHLDLMQRIEIAPASVSIIDVFAETARIVLLNDTGNL